MAGKSVNSIGAKNWAPNSPATRYNASGKNREFYTFENAPGIGAYATGGTIIDGGDGYIYHIFTGDGTFAVNRPPAAIDSVDYLIAAGGGGSVPSPVARGGGGGGGFRFGNVNVTTGPYTITVGAGGPSGPGINGPVRNGNPSTAFGLTATGGGGGGSPASPGGVGGSGGSGGGGGVPIGTLGSAISVIPRQGYNGGFGGVTGAGGGGGGGAGGVGGAGSGPPAVGGVGGPGRIAPEFPSTIVAKAIPAPVLPAWSPLVSSDGYAKGGFGGPTPAPVSRTSPANSGYGGQNTGFAGGSGIVCIRYKKNAPYIRATGGTVEPSTDPEHPGVWRHIFTSPGDFTVTDPTLQYVDYLAVGGGGGGGGVYGGGGGAGGFVSSIHTSTTTPTAIPEAYPWNPGYSVEVGEQYPVGVGTYAVVIGTGGAGGSGSGSPGTQGNPTTIGTGPNQINANGGGSGGGGTTPTPTVAPGGSGGSGGGAGRAGPLGPPTPIAGPGVASPFPLIQGNGGGSTSGFVGAHGGGGGGAGGGAGPIAGSGPGWYSVLSPSAYGTPGPLTPTPQYRYFAGGGGGGRGVAPAPTTGLAGGAGGGGAGGSVGVSTGTPGTVNTGGGGGGGADSPTYSIGGSGGPGIVIIQYPE
jgi:hypothetical protein